MQGKALHMNLDPFRTIIKQVLGSNYLDVVC